MKADHNAVLHLAGACLLLVLSSCATIVTLDSDYGNFGAVPVAADISVKFNNENLAKDLKLNRAQSAIEKVIVEDLHDNLFGNSGGPIHVDIKVEKMTSVDKMVLGQYVANAGFGLWLLGMATESNLDMAVGSIALTASVFMQRYSRDVNTSVEAAISYEGVPIGRYEGTDETSGKIYWIGGDTKKDVYAESLEKSLNKLKDNILADREYILSATDVREVASKSIYTDVSSTGKQILLHQNIAVIDLDGIGVSNTDARAITHRLRYELLRTGSFTILERDKMESILLEQGFQMSGCTESSCLVRAGQILNVQGIIAGNVSKVGNIYSMQVRYVDVQSGEILREAVTDYKGDIGEVLVKGVKRISEEFTQ